MPHFVLEYSDNIIDEINVDLFFQELHEVLVNVGSFPMSAIKSRAIKHSMFRVADGNDKNVFIHLSLAILAGKDSDFLQEISSKLFEVLKYSFSKTIQEVPHSVTFEIRELNNALYLKTSTT